MHHIGPRPRAEFPEEYGGYRLYRDYGCVYAVPPPLDARRLHRAGTLDGHPDVLCATSRREIETLIDSTGLPPQGEDAGPALASGLREVMGCSPVEFAGWLPIYDYSGNCGKHPQFTHTHRPPAGYRFTRSAPPEPEAPLGPSLLGRAWSAIGSGLGRVGGLLRPLTALFRPVPGAGLRGRGRVLSAMLRMFWKCRAAGAGLGATLRFLQSRHLRSQLLLANHPGPVFLTSMPYTYGQWPWLVEIEDPTTLFYPLVQNGGTHEMDLRSSPYYPAVKALLEDDSCKGIITHMRSTAELVTTLFQSDTIAAKVTHGPMGVKLPDAHQQHEATKADSPIDMLFINSWCQVPSNFFLRGGLDVLEAFARVRERFPRLRLTMRTALPPLGSRYRRLLESGWVRIIDRFMPAEEMAALHASSHIFLLPAARIHVVSLLQAMSHGLAVVASDGWGFEEYLDDGRNGLVVPGRYGRTSWADHEAGMLREDYEPMYMPDPKVVDGLVSAMTRLAESRELRGRLGRAAREDVATQYSLANWNATLGVAFDRARGVEARGRAVAA